MEDSIFDLLKSSSTSQNGLNVLNASTLIGIFLLEKRGPKRAEVEQGFSGLSKNHSKMRNFVADALLKQIHPWN